MNSNVSLHTLDFESAEFLETLIQVGQTLPWQQFVIYITLPSPLETHISVSLSFRGLLKHAKQEVFVSMDKVKLLAKRKLLDSGFKTADVIMKKMIDTIEDTETDVEFVARSRTVSSQEEWVDMLSELEVQRFKNKEKVAACSTNRLKELNFTSSQDSVNDSSVLLANAFRKKLKWSHGARPVFDLFMLTITAAKLGLPAKVLQSNTDFYMFARKNALHRYFLVFNHQVRYDPLTLEVSVLYKGQFEKWKVITFTWLQKKFFINIQVNRSNNTPLAGRPVGYDGTLQPTRYRRRRTL